MTAMGYLTPLVHTSLFDVRNTRDDNRPNKYAGETAGMPSFVVFIVFVTTFKEHANEMARYYLHRTVVRMGIAADGRALVKRCPRRSPRRKLGLGREHHARFRHRPVGHTHGSGTGLSAHGR